MTTENLAGVFGDAHGLKIFHYNEAETKFVYQEIFEDKIYFRHGITLQPGDCAWDIGANIGLFSIFVQENFKDITIHAFEPCPPIYDILTANAARYAPRVVAHRLGVSGQAREATFTFYPKYSIMSGFKADSARDTETLRAAIVNHRKQRYPTREEMDHGYLADMVQAALDQKQEYVCTLKNISDLIVETNTSHIDLLKIDAEGCELEILAGIRDEHWPMIRQIVMEIHDNNGDVANPISKILDSRNFKTIMDQQGGPRSGLLNCYAVRIAG